MALLNYAGRRPKFLRYSAISGLVNTNSLVSAINLINNFPEFKGKYMAKETPNTISSDNAKGLADSINYNALIYGSLNFNNIQTFNVIEGHTSKNIILVSSSKSTLVVAENGMLGLVVPHSDIPNITAGGGGGFAACCKRMWDNIINGKCGLLLEFTVYIATVEVAAAIAITCYFDPNANCPGFSIVHTEKNLDALINKIQKY